MGHARTWALTLVAVTLGAGCGSIRMVAPADVVAASTELAVQDRSSWSGAMADESFKLGPYKVGDVDRDWDSGTDASLLGFSNETTEGGYSFTLSGADTSLSGMCTTAANNRQQDLGSGFSIGNETRRLGCFCKQGDAVAHFTISSSSSSESTGELFIEGSRHYVAGVYERESGTSGSEPSGYRVDASNGPLGAADVVKPGRVWIGRNVSAEQHPFFACLFAGMLLYMPPTHNFD